MVLKVFVVIWYLLGDIFDIRVVDVGHTLANEKSKYHHGNILYLTLNFSMLDRGSKLTFKLSF